jgi:hypothetical protein
MHSKKQDVVSITQPEQRRSKEWSSVQLEWLPCCFTYQPAGDESEIEEGEL